MEEHYEIVQFSIIIEITPGLLSFYVTLLCTSSRKLETWSAAFSRATSNVIVLILRSHWQIIMWLYVLIGRRDYFNASFYDSKLKTALLHRSLIVFFQHHTDKNETKRCVDA